MKTPLRLLTLLTLLLAVSGWSCRPDGSGRAADEHEGHDHDADSDDHDADGDDHDDDHEGDEHEEHGGDVSLNAQALEFARIRTEPVRREAWSGGLETTAEVHFDDTRLAHVSPRLDGRIHRVLVQLGDQVEAGQAIASIDSLELGRAKADYLADRARLDLAERTLEREQSLLEKRISSEQEVLEAQAAREEAAASYRNARDTLQVFGLDERAIRSVRHSDPSAPIHTVRAPIAGKVIDLHATLGELVGRDSQLATVADLDRLWLWVDIHEGDIGGIRVGAPATIRLDAFPGEPIEGSLAYVRDELDRDTRVVRARIDVANPDHRIKPGMFGRVTLRSGPEEEAGSVLIVAAGAVQREGREFIVFVRESEGVFERRTVSVGRRAPGVVEILSGLEAGEAAVVEGGFILKSESGKGEMGGGHSH